MGTKLTQKQRNDQKIAIQEKIDELEIETFEYLVNRVRVYYDYKTANIFLLRWMENRDEYNQDSEIGDLIAKMGKLEDQLS